MRKRGLRSALGIMVGDDPRTCAYTPAPARVSLPLVHAAVAIVAVALVLLLLAVFGALGFFITAGALKALA